MASKEIIPQRCGVKFDPPAVVLIYKMNPTGKLHRRTMPLRKFSKNSGVARVSEELKNNDRHSKYLAKIPLHQVERLVTVIQDHMNGMSLSESLERNKEIDQIDPNEDLNKVEPEVLKRKKAVMAETFERHQKKPGDPDFKYDVEVDFEQSGAIESCEWDSDGSDPEF